LIDRFKSNGQRYFVLIYDRVYFHYDRKCIGKDTRYFLKMRRLKRKKTKDILPNIIIKSNIFWKHILDTLQKNNNKLEWNVYFSTLQYSKELLQHFYTGHKLLYSELIEVIDLETKAADSKKKEEIYKSINQLIESDIKKNMQLNLPISFGQCEACIKYYSWTDRLLFKRSLSKFRMPD
jgi:hypothetical protein